MIASQEVGGNGLIISYGNPSAEPGDRIAIDYDTLSHRGPFNIIVEPLRRIWIGTTRRTHTLSPYVDHLYGCALRGFGGKVCRSYKCYDTAGNLLFQFRKARDNGATIRQRRATLAFGSPTGPIDVQIEDESPIRLARGTVVTMSDKLGKQQTTITITSGGSVTFVTDPYIETKFMRVGNSIIHDGDTYVSSGQQVFEFYLCFLHSCEA